MKFNCQQNDLLEIVTTVHRAVATRTTVSILTGMYISVENSTLTLEATDMELRISAKLDVQVEEEGKAVVPARYFTDLVKRLPDSVVEIGTLENDNIVYINYDSSTVKLNCFNFEEFPEIDDKEMKNYFSIDPEIINESVRQVSIAASKDESRPIFTGILFHYENNDEVVMVATDSHRLAKKDLKVKSIEENISEINAIIPARALNEVSRVISNSMEENIDVGFSDTQVYFKCRNISIHSQLIEGQFPQYKEVIPDQIVTSIEAGSDDLYSSLNRAALMSFTEFKGKGNIIKLNIEGDSINIYSHSSDVGEIDEKLPVSKEGEDLEISFNVKYLMDVLRVLNSENVRIQFSGALSPALVKPGESDNYLYLVLPIRT